MNNATTTDAMKIALANTNLGLTAISLAAYISITATGKTNFAQYLLDGNVSLGYSLATLQARVDGSAAIVAAEIAATPALVNALTFTDALTVANDGKTKILLGALSVVGNTFVYLVLVNAAAVPTPIVEDDLSSWTAIGNAGMITAANGTNIGVAEIDAAD